MGIGKYVSPLFFNSAYSVHFCPLLSTSWRFFFYLLMALTSSLALPRVSAAPRLRPDPRHGIPPARRHGGPCRSLGCLGGLAAGAVAPARRRLWRGGPSRGCRAMASQASQSAEVDVLLLLGNGQCPWGEGGTETMTAALGFAEPVTWEVAIKQLAWKLQQAVPGLEVQISSGVEKTHAKLVVLINVDPELLVWHCRPYFP